MIEKLLSKTTSSITGAAILLGLSSFASRAIGLLRDRIFAHQFGAGATLDAYYAAFRIPDLLYNLIVVGALSAGFIPVFLDLYVKDKKEAWRLTNAIITISGVILVVISTILFIVAPLFIPWTVPGFSLEKQELTILLTRIMLVSPILLGISSIVSGVLQSLKSFVIYSLTPIVYNIGIIVGALLFVPIWGVRGLGYGVLLGALLHLAIQLPALFAAGFRLRPIWATEDPSVKKIGRLMLPRTLGLAASQINLVAITMIASTLPTGSLSLFNFANNLQYFPVGIIGVSFAIAAFPTLAEAVAKNDRETLVSYLIKTVRQILFLIIPATILFLLLRAQIVRVVLGSGAFDWNATIATGNALAFFALSLFAQCLIPLLVRAFFALHDTWTPFIISVISVLVNIIASLVLKDVFGVVGLAAAFSIGMVIQLTLLWISLHAKIGSLRELSLLPLLYTVSAAAIPMAIAIQFFKSPIARWVDMTKFWGIFLQGFGAGMIGLGVYVAICYVLRLDEVEDLKQTIKRRLFSVAMVPKEVREEEL